MAEMNRVVAIDGPAGAGKSTVARELGRLLGFCYVDSGALYRIMTWEALRQGVDPEDAAAMSALAERVEVAFAVEAGSMTYRVGGVEPGAAIRTPEINRYVSPVSRVPAVRARVTAWLRQMRVMGALVVEGRDIGSVVFADTPARFYLDADPEERARRRHLEEQGKGIDQGREAVLSSLMNRDRIDSSRATAPLRIADGAQVIDSTRLSIIEVLGTIVDHLPAAWRPVA